MKQNLFTILFCLCTALLYGQTPLLQALYLEDGSVIYGRYQSETETGFSWELTSGSVIEINRSEVLKVKNLDENYQLSTGGKMIPKKGFYFNFGSGFQLEHRQTWSGESENDITWGYIQAAAGCRFHRLLQAGLKVGATGYDYGFVDISADLRGDILNKAITPFYEANLGYGLLTSKISNDWSETTHKGGRLLQLGGGIKIYTRNKIAWTLSGGYRFQKSSIQYDWDQSKRKLTYKRIYFGAGMTF